MAVNNIPSAMHFVGCYITASRIFISKHDSTSILFLVYLVIAITFYFYIIRSYCIFISSYIKILNTSLRNIHITPRSNTDACQYRNNNNAQSY